MRHLAIIFTFALLVVALTGCGNGAPTEGDTVKQNAAIPGKTSGEGGNTVDPE
jgi:hypothetical protein